MQYISLIVLLMIFIFIVKNPKVDNPLTLFVLMWFFIILISSIGVQGILIPSQFAYSIVLLGIFFFSFGSIVRIGKEKIEDSKKNEKYEINYPIAIIFGLISIIIILPEAVVSFKLLLSGFKLGNIHFLFTERYEQYYTSYFSEALNYLFFYPTIYSLCIISAYDFWFGKKNKFLQSVTFVLVSLKTIQYGGRAPITYMVFFYGVGYIIYNYEYKRNNHSYRERLQINKKRRRGKVLVIFLLIIVGWSILSRLYNGIEGVPRFFAIYFSGCIEVMSKKLETSSSSITCGGLSFFGFIKFIHRIISNIAGFLGVTYRNSFYDFLNSEILYLEEAVSIGTVGNANAFVTPFYYFYKDFGLIGVCIMSGIWGFLCKRAYENVRLQINVRSIFFLMFWLFTIVFSMVRCWFATPEFALAFLMPLIFIKKKEN